MSAVYNPEVEIMTQIERLDIEARNVRGRIEHAINENDKRVLNRLLRDLKDEIEHLQERLP